MIRTGACWSWHADLWAQVTGLETCSVADNPVLLIARMGECSIEVTLVCFHETITDKSTQ